MTRRRRAPRRGLDDRGRKVARFYAEMSSLATIKWALAEHRLELGQASPRDLYSRGLDVQNLGGFAALEAIAQAVDEYGAPRSDALLLDVACGLGGPGRYLAERYQARVVGVDLVPERVKLARHLTEAVGLGKRITYRVADATDLPFAAGKFAQVWMLDASIHVRQKRKLLRELARVLAPGGLLVLHDMPGPLPRSMAAVTRRAPYHAPTVAELVGHAQSAKLRVLTWRDTTVLAAADFEQKRAAVEKAESALVAAGASEEARRRFEPGRAVLHAYLEALGPRGPGCGFLIARR